MRFPSLVFGFILGAGAPAFAQSLPELIDLALSKSPEMGASKAEIKIQEETAKSIDQARLVPQVGLGIAAQQLRYDRMKDDGTGHFVSNDGSATSFNVTLTYDLQKVFGPESELADLTRQNAEWLHQITRRSVVRDVKKSFFTILELRDEIAAFRAALDRFNRVGGVLDRERRMGVDTKLEGGQFRLQRDLVEADLATRTADLEAAYAQLANLLGETAERTEKRFVGALVLGPARFPDGAKISTDQLAITGDPVLLKTLRADANLAQAEADRFARVPLPSVSLKASRDQSTVFSGDGPVTTIEVGVTLPLDAFVTRATQKSLLGAKALKALSLADRALMDYSNQIRLQASQLKRASLQQPRLAASKEDSQRLLDQAFKFYGQKRIDAIGTTDLFQKHLQAVRNFLVNRQQAQNADAELEYLVGGNDR